MSQRGSHDPNALGAPYTPLRSSERALRKLADWSGLGEPSLVLLGPAGSGKTRVLSEMAERASGSFRVASITNPGVNAVDVCRRVLEEFDERVTDEVEADLAAFARRSLEEYDGVMLLLDNAQQLQVTSARTLAKVGAAAREY